MRHLKTKADIETKYVHVEQLFTFSSIERDPRGRVVGVAYLVLSSHESLTADEKVDTHEAWWSTIAEARKLAYDHDEILKVALKRIASRCTYTTLINKLMPKKFTLTELEQAYEIVTGKVLDKRNFRKKILSLDILKELKEKKSEGAHRPAQLYSFASSKVEEIQVL